MTEFKLEDYDIQFDCIFKHDEIFQAYMSFIKKYTKNNSGIIKNFMFLQVLHEKKEYIYDDKIFKYANELEINETVKKDTVERLEQYIDYCQGYTLELNKEIISKILETMVDVIKKELILNSFPLFIRSKDISTLFKK